VITTVAGDGPGYSGDGGPATSAQLNTPVAVAVDAAGNIYIADSANNRIRKVSPGGIISTVAGNGIQGFAGDGGLATSAELAMPSGVAVDGAGNIYIADSANWRIRKVSPSGVITTVAGGGGSAFWFGGGAPGDGGPATSATLSNPQGVAVDAAGNLYIADSQDYAIRMVNVSGTINTVAGNGSPGSSGDGGPATSAQIGYVAGLTVDAGGNIYIGDHDNNRVRKITPNGIITTVAGNGSNGFSGDGGPATDAQFSGPQGVSVDRVGNLYLGDWGNQRIRKVTPSGTVTTVAGNGTPGFAGDGGPATNAELAGPVGVAVDASGNVYIADFGNNRIRKITFAAPNGQ
jgi:sugar lactone lactonase YvrE